MKTRALVPEYFAKFQCAGSACKYTCCQNWGISLTREYVDMIRSKIGDPEIAAAIKRNRSHHAAGYAHIQLNDDGSCPFLRDGLCRLQKEYGEAFLSHTCKYYPRVFAQFGNACEAAMLASCPEIIRFFLADRKPMEFLYAEIETEHALITDYSAAKLGSAQTQRAFELRSHIIDILQDRRFPLEIRLFILGFFLKKLRDDDSGAAAAHSKETLLTLFSEPGGCDGFYGVPGSIEVQRHISMEIIGRYLVDGQILDKQYRAMIMRISAALHQLDGSSDEVITNAYKDALAACKAAYLTENSHVLEHFLVNEIFRACLPLPFPALWKCYLHIVAIYALARFHLVGFFAAGSKLDDAGVITCLTLFRRAFFHSREVSSTFVHVLESSGWDDFAHAAILLRD